MGRCEGALTPCAWARGDQVEAKRCLPLTLNCTVEDVRCLYVPLRQSRGKAKGTLEHQPSSAIFFSAHNILRLQLTPPIWPVLYCYFAFISPISTDIRCIPKAPPDECLYVYRMSRIAHSPTSLHAQDQKNGESVINLGQRASLGRSISRAPSACHVRAPQMPCASWIPTVLLALQLCLVNPLLTSCAVSKGQSTQQPP